MSYSRSLARAAPRAKTRVNRPPASIAEIRDADTARQGILQLCAAVGWPESGRRAWNMHHAHYRELVRSHPRELWRSIESEIARLNEH
jgi:hypothetical protein